MSSSALVSEKRCPREYHAAWHIVNDIEQRCVWHALARGVRRTTIHRVDARQTVTSNCGRGIAGHGSHSCLRDRRACIAGGGAVAACVADTHPTASTGPRGVWTHPWSAQHGSGGHAAALFPCLAVPHQSTAVQGYGVSYRNMLPKKTSKHLMRAIQPLLVLSGDDHDFCEHQHEHWQSPDLPGPLELTFCTFSWCVVLLPPLARGCSFVGVDMTGSKARSVRALACCRFSMMAMGSHILGELRSMVVCVAMPES